MERSLGATFFLIASVAFSIAFGAWWLGRSVFTPDGSTDSAVAFLEDADIRRELTALIAPLAAPVMDTSSEDLATRLEAQVFPLREGAAEMAPILKRAHEIIIGEREGPLTITGAELIGVVRDQRVADLPEFKFPLDEIGTLSTFDAATRWMMPIGAGLGLIMTALGLITRPDRREVINAFGELLAVTAAGVLLFGWAIPVYLFTAVDSSTWTKAAPHLAMRSMPATIGTAVVLAVGGAGLILTSRSGGSRKQWSTPLATARYRGGDNPGWS